MGRRIIAQRRGRGSSTFRVPPRSFSPVVQYSNQVGVVTDIVNDTGRNAPLAEVQYSDKHVGYVIAPEGLKVGDVVNDYVMTLSDIPEGSDIFAIESSPNSGPTFCRTPGSSAILVSKGKKCSVKLPSKVVKTFHPECRATIGIPAGDGRKDKPILKAGKKWIIAHR
ncbi:MAG: 50S ribosomal protein L2, partial [Candidatus Aenigmatarchaeota archaeon]